MAVRVPTTTSVCLNCKINSDANAGMEFHEIFDEVGLELQLPFLVKTFFHIDLSKKDKQHLCDDCVNRLIELYDLDEHAKDKRCKTNNLKNNTESSNEEENESGNFSFALQNFRKTFVIDENNTKINLPKSNSIEYTRENAVEIHNQNKSEDKDCTEYKNIEGEGYIFNKNGSAPFAEQHNQSSNDIGENFPEEDFGQTDKNEVSQGFNISLSSSVIKDEKSYLLESIEYMECIRDDEIQNVEINKQSNAKIIVGSIQLEIKEQEDSHDFNISSNSIKNEKLDELESNEHMEFISDDESQNLEINEQSNSNIIVNVREEVDVGEKSYTTKKTYNKNEGQKDLYVEDVDNRSNQVLNSGDSNSLLEELKTTEEKEAFLLNASSSEKEFNSIKNIDADDFIEQADISADKCSLEEENLFDETILSEGYDQVDLNDYLDKVLKTKFQDLLLTCEMECKLCLEKYNCFGKLLNHACVAEFEKMQQLSCIIKDCEEDAKDLPTLARHLVLKHYDKLERCTACQKSFSNVLNFNKHCCYRNIKRRNNVPDFKCKYCDLDIPSLKRYLFHMQFHLKKHRPKICLLCGDVFNNSNDFFEHTQYKHNPETASPCVRCKRPFRDIQAFNNHLELYETCKYHECALCQQRYSTQLDLKQHMDIYHHNNLKYIQCKLCPKKFGYRNSYFNHIKTHTTDTNVVHSFICSTCGLICCNEEMIKDHIGSDNESPCFSSPVDKKVLSFCYSCENCSLDFFTIKHLKDHRLSDSHSDDLFPCGKGFNALSHMRYHCFNHNKCKEWQNSFPKTRYFVCNIGDCQKFYTTWSSLYHHNARFHKTERKKNAPREFICQFCHQFYSSKQGLAVHVTRNHQNASTYSMSSLQQKL